MEHKRRSLRLKGYDYAQNGFYFVTVCVKNKQPMLGDITAGIMTSNGYGCIVEDVWNELPEHYTYCRLDQYVVMPDHFHGIIEIVGAGFKTRSYTRIVRDHPCI